MDIVVVDTNVILNHYLNRPGKALMDELLQHYEAGRRELYIPLPVILEFEWVSRSYYKIDKDVIIQHLDEILETASAQEPYHAICQIALKLYAKSTGVSFDDCVIVIVARRLGAKDLVTNDRRLKKLVKSL